MGILMSPTILLVLSKLSVIYLWNLRFSWYNTAKSFYWVFLVSKLTIPVASLIWYSSSYFIFPFWMYLHFKTLKRISLLFNQPHVESKINVKKIESKSSCTISDCISSWVHLSTLHGTHVRDRAILQAEALSPFLKRWQLFHPYQEIAETNVQILGLVSFWTLSWSLSGPNAFEGFKLFSNLITSSVDTKILFIKGGNLPVNGTSLYSVLNASLNWPISSSPFQSDFAITVPSPFLRGGIPWLSFFWLFKYL